MAVLLAFVALYLLLLAGLAVLIARLVARRAGAGRNGAIAIAAGIVWLGIALTPIPTHGGLMLLGPTLIREGLRALERRAQDRSADRPPARPLGRFAGYLPAEALGGSWRDDASGLVWSPRVGSVDRIDAQALAVARRLCQAHAPHGYWAVPRNAEYLVSARRRSLGGPWLAEALLWPENISFAVLVNTPATTPLTDPEQRPRPATIPVRCVGVTPPAPADGYLPADIPLEEWNRFQLGLEPPPQAD